MKIFLKKFIAIAMLLLTLCISIGSCKKELYDIKQKEEGYNPEQKIKKIYISNYSGPKYLIQEWTWSEDKLMKVEYYRHYEDSISSGVYVCNTEYYTYDDDKLVKVADKNGYLQISYTNSRYGKIEYYWNEGNRFIATWDFSYKNNKVSKITLTLDYSDIWSEKVAQGGLFSSLIPKKFISGIMSSAKSSTEDTFPMTMIVTYKYNGDNVKEQKFTAPGTNDCLTYTYGAYDKMQNPFYKYVGLMNPPPYMVHTIDMVTSKSNPLKMIVFYPVPWYNSVAEYSYIYKDGFPIEVKVVTVGSFPNQYKLYYEYE